MQANKARLNELRQAIEKRKKLIEDTGYEHRERNQKDLRDQVFLARTRLAELQQSKQSKQSSRK